LQEERLDALSSPRLDGLGLSSFYASLGYCEIRPLYEAADFGDAMTPEIAEAEGRIRKKLSDV
jgi:hypothetical protein